MQMGHVCFAPAKQLRQAERVTIIDPGLAPEQHHPSARLLKVLGQGTAYIEAADRRTEAARIQPLHEAMNHDFHAAHVKSMDDVHDVMPGLHAESLGWIGCAIVWTSPWSTSRLHVPG